MRKNFVCVMMLAILTVCLVGVGASFGAAPDAIVFEGRLTDNSDNPVTTSTTATFKIYDALSGGAALWTSGSYTFTPDSNGIFSVVLGTAGSENALNASVLTGSNAYLEMTIGGTALSPLIRMASVPYALVAQKLGSRSESDFVTSIASNSATALTGAVTIAAGANIAVTQSGGTITITGTASSGMSNPMSALGDTIYGGTAGAAIRLAGNTSSSKNFLTQTGADGGASAAPAWGTLEASDIPSIDTSKLTSGTLGITRGGTGLSTIPANGELLIGNTATGSYVQTELTAGTGISISNGAGSITVATTQDLTTTGTATLSALTLSAASPLTLSNATSSTIAATKNLHLKSGGAAGGISLYPSTDQTTAVSFTNAAANANMLVIDTSNNRVTFGNGNVASGLSGGSGLILIANAATAPAGNPSSGGALYVDSGALIYKGSSSSVTTIAGADYAEYVPVTANIESGDIVALTNQKNQTAKSTLDAYLFGKAIKGGTPMAGIISSYAGAKDPHTGEMPLAFIGRVPVKVCNENGNINIGDVITVSDRPGIGMKAAVGDPTVGVAMEPFNGKDTGLIHVLVTRNNEVQFRPLLEKIASQEKLIDSLTLRLSEMEKKFYSAQK